MKKLLTPPSWASGPGIFPLKNHGHGGLWLDSGLYLFHSNKDNGPMFWCLWSGRGDFDWPRQKYSAKLYNAE